NIFDRFYSFSSRVGISRSPPCSFSRGCVDIVRLLKRCARPLAWPTPFFLDLATIGRSNNLPGLFPFGSFFAGGSPFQPYRSPAPIPIRCTGSSPRTAGYLENWISWYVQLYHRLSPLFVT